MKYSGLTSPPRTRGDCVLYIQHSTGPWWLSLTGSGMPVSSVGRVPLLGPRPQGELLVLRVDATSVVVRRPAPGVRALLRVVHPPAGAHQQSSVSDCVAAVVAIGCAAAVHHAEMVEAGTGPRPGPRGVHGAEMGGGSGVKPRGRMDVVRKDTSVSRSLARSL